MTNDGQSSDPRACLPAAVAAVSNGADLDAQLAGVLDAVATGLAAAMGAVFIADPDRAGLVLAQTSGMDAASDAFLSDAVTDPTHPFAEAARERIAVFGREGATPDGAPIVGAYLPLLVSNGGVEQALGSIGFIWPAPHDLSAETQETLTAIAGLAASPWIGHG